MGAEGRRGRGGRLHFCSQKQGSGREDSDAQLFLENVYLFLTHWGLVLNIYTICKKERKETGNEKVSRQKEDQIKFQRPPTSIFFLRGRGKANFFFFLKKNLILLTDDSFMTIV